MVKPLFPFRNLPLIVCTFIVFACDEPMAVIDENDDDIVRLAPDPYEQNAKIGRGINLGNALEAPAEGDWGMTLEEEYFVAIKEAGFNSVRIPIRWSTHASETPPYFIEPTFMSRVDWAIDRALANGLMASFRGSG